jgi:hypothetical protein
VVNAQASPPERNTAIHYWVPLDIRKVIDSDEAMPYQLRVDPKRHYRQTEQDEKIGSLKCCNLAGLERFRGSFVGGGKADSFSLLRCPFSHAVCDAIR